MYLLSMMLVYAAAMIAANLSVAHFGPSVAPINAFLLIGLDLVVRDVLHERLTRAQMASMIIVTSMLTYLFAPGAAMIAVASAAAFGLASLADWAIFSRLGGWGWMARSNASNVGGAIVDSLVFPTIAFGAWMPEIVLLQCAAKIAGGALWALPFGSLRRRTWR